MWGLFLLSIFFFLSSPRAQFISCKFQRDPLFVAVGGFVTEGDKTFRVLSRSRDGEGEGVRGGAHGGESQQELSHEMGSVGRREMGGVDAGICDIYWEAGSNKTRRN